MRVLALAGAKGGVGKTTAAVTLASLAAAQGLRALVVDLDAQGAASYLLHAAPKPKDSAATLLSGDRPVSRSVRSSGDARLDVLPANETFRLLDVELSVLKKPSRRLRQALRPVDDAYDVAVLDCPPGLTLLGEAVLDAADLVLVPIAPSPLGLRAWEQVGTFVAALPHPPLLRGFWSMVDRRRAMHATTIADVTRPGVYPVVIPAAAVVERMAERRAPVTAFARTSPAAVAYRELWSRAAEELGLR